jgi:DCN1-like protein 1/2
VDGTIKFCEDLAVDPEDVVLLAIAYELKSPRMGQWTRQGWIEGWKAIGYVAHFRSSTDLVLSYDCATTARIQ